MLAVIPMYHGKYHGITCQCITASITVPSIAVSLVSRYHVILRCHWYSQTSCCFGCGATSVEKQLSDNLYQNISQLPTTYYDLRGASTCTRVITSFQLGPRECTPGAQKEQQQQQTNKKTNKLLRNWHAGKPLIKICEVNGRHCIEGYKAKQSINMRICAHYSCASNNNEVVQIPTPFERVTLQFDVIDKVDSFEYALVCWFC